MDNTVERKASEYRGSHPYRPRQRDDLHARPLPDARNGARMIRSPHQWTHDGSEVLILRYCAADGTSSYGFRYPLKIGSVVEAPDWSPEDRCGGGLHGWPWALSIGSGSDPDFAALWQVYSCAPKDVVGITEDGGGKCKFRAGTLRFSGAWYAALEFVRRGRDAWIVASSEGAATTTGWRCVATTTDEQGAASATGWQGAASATGWQGAASATGFRGAATTTGKQGAASATGGQGAASATGERGVATTTGERGAAAVTGFRGTATATGEGGVASATGRSSAAIVTGPEGRAKAGLFGCIALAWWNPVAHRSEMRCALTGCAGGLKADTWYRLNAAGAFQEASE